MSEASVSAVITAYNCADFIAEAIESVLAQTCRPGEILVVDDGSTDRTRQVVSAYKERGVNYLYQPNQGAGAARNQGILNTQGDFIAFLDADDLWLADKTRCQLKAMLANPQVALVGGQAWWWDIQAEKRWLVNFPQREMIQGRRDILVQNWIGNPSMVMLRRNALMQAGLFNPSLRWGEDWELWIRIISRFQVLILPEAVIVYRSHAGNLSHERRQEKLACDWLISRRAIAGYRPAWLRRVLLARAWSHIELQRAQAAREDGQSWWKTSVYACLALLSNPFEDIREKVILLTRSLTGEGIYQHFHRILKAPASGRHWGES